LILFSQEGQKFVNYPYKILLLSFTMIALFSFERKDKSGAPIVENDGFEINKQE